MIFSLQGNSVQEELWQTKMTFIFPIISFKVMLTYYVKTMFFSPQSFTKEDK